MQPGNLGESLDPAHPSLPAPDGFPMNMDKRSRESCDVADHIHLPVSKVARFQTNMSKPEQLVEVPSNLFQGMSCDWFGFEL